MSTTSVFCYGAEILFPMNIHKNHLLTFLVKFSNLHVASSVYWFPDVECPTNSPPSLQQLSLLKFMTNFETAEDFDDYLNDDGNIESAIVRNVCDEFILSSKQLPEVYTLQDEVFISDTIVGIYQNRHYDIENILQQIVDSSISYLCPLSKKLEVVAMKTHNNNNRNEEEMLFYLTVQDNNENSKQSTSPINKKANLNVTPVDKYTELAFNCVLKELRRMNIATDDEPSFLLLSAIDQFDY